MALRMPEGARPLKAEDRPKLTSVNKLIACLEALGATVRTLWLGGGQLCVLGIRAEIQLAVEARYDMGETPKGAPSAKFAWAKVHDPIGIVRNLEFDYTIGPRDQKNFGIPLEHAEKLSAKRNAEYNDGAQHTFKVAMFTSAGDLNEWLDEWIDTLGVDHKKQSAKKGKTKTEKNTEAVLTGGIWEG